MQAQQDTSLNTRQNTCSCQRWRQSSGQPFRQRRIEPQWLGRSLKHPGAGSHHARFLRVVSTDARIFLSTSRNMKYGPGFAAANAFIRSRALSRPSTTPNHRTSSSSGERPEKISNDSDIIVESPFRKNTQLLFGNGKFSSPTIQTDKYR